MLFRSDQGVQTFRYEFMRMGGEGYGDVIREARALNTEPTVILENNHRGTLSLVYEGICVDRENVQISAVKRSEDGRGVIVRLYETDGVDTEVSVCGSILPKPLNARIGHYSVNTYFIADKDSEWREILLTEFDIKRP